MLFPQGNDCPGVYYYTRAVTPQGTDCPGVYYYTRAVTPQGTKDPALTLVVPQSVPDGEKLQDLAQTRRRKYGERFQSHLLVKQVVLAVQPEEKLRQYSEVV